MRYRSLLLVICLGATPAMAVELPDAAGDAIDASQPAPAATVAEPAQGDAARSSAADPWQGFNRNMFRFNDTLDRYALKPVAKGYRKIAPRPVRTGVTNFFYNLRFPIVMLNDLLQGKVKAAGTDTARFVINTTVGVAGFIDVSARMGLARNDEDFGQTLGTWGVGSGPYLVLPFLGPSTVRDGFGLVVDGFAHPRAYMDHEVAMGLVAVEVVNTRANLLEVEDIIQGDRYLFIRDLYLQRRDFSIKDGKVESDPFLEGDEDWEEEEENADDAPLPVEQAPEVGAVDASAQEAATEPVADPAQDSAPAVAAPEAGAAPDESF